MKPEVGMARCGESHMASTRFANRFCLLLATRDE